MTQTKPGGFLSLLVPHQTPNFEPPAAAPVVDLKRSPTRRKGTASLNATIRSTGVST